MKVQERDFVAVNDINSPFFNWEGTVTKQHSELNTHHERERGVRYFVVDFKIGLPDFRCTFKEHQLTVLRATAS